MRYLNDTRTGTGKGCSCNPFNVIHIRFCFVLLLFFFFVNAYGSTGAFVQPFQNDLATYKVKHLGIK